jgi:hypothetical protein
MRRLGGLLLVGFLVSASLAASRIPVATWSFDGDSGIDVIRGFHRFVEGMAGAGLRFDGQTTVVVRAAARAPRVRDAFSVEAWIALQAYPWTWCAVVNQEKDHRAGFFFGIDPEGRLGLQVAVGGRWQGCRSTVGLPLYSWNHILGTFDPAAGLKLYLNGKSVGEKTAIGPPRFAPEADVWIGRNQTPLGLSEEIRVVAPVAFSFDGIIDEVRIYDVALGPAEAGAVSARLRPEGPPPLRPPVLPSGPEGPSPVFRGMGESVACRRSGRRRCPFRRNTQPARLLARHELYPRLGHRERHLVHQRILRNPDPDDADKRRTDGRQTGPVLASPDPREQ